MVSSKMVWKFNFHEEIVEKLSVEVGVKFMTPGEAGEAAEEVGVTSMIIN